MLRRHSRRWSHSSHITLWRWSSHLSHILWCTSHWSTTWSLWWTSHRSHILWRTSHWSTTWSLWWTSHRSHSLSSHWSTTLCLRSHTKTLLRCTAHCRTTSKTETSHWSTSWHTVTYRWSTTFWFFTITVLRWRNLLWFINCHNSCHINLLDFILILILLLHYPNKRSLITQHLILDRQINNFWLIIAWFTINIKLIDLILTSYLEKVINIVKWLQLNEPVFAELMADWILAFWIVFARESAVLVVFELIFCHDRAISCQLVPIKLVVFYFFWWVH